MIQGLWDCQVDAIIDVKLEGVDADTYKYEPMTSLLARWEKIKKYKHNKHCHNQRKHFLLFVLSVDGILGRKSLVILSQFSRVMEEKGKESLSQVRGWVKKRIAISMVSYYSQMICRVRLPRPLREREPVWDPELGIGLAD